MRLETERIEPLEYNVLVRIDEVSEQTEGGLYIPQDVREKEEFAQCVCTVLAVSPFAFRFEDGDVAVDPGDRVVISKYAGQFLPGHEKRVKIVKDKDIVARLK